MLLQTTQTLLFLFSALQVVKASWTADIWNNVEDLIIENYLHKTVANWRNKNVINKLKLGETQLIVDELKGLYRTLRFHPALMDRRLQVGGRTPPKMPINTYEFMDDYTSNVVEKRGYKDFIFGLSTAKKTFNIGSAQPVCPVITEWRRLSRSKDMNGTEVEVFQPGDNDRENYQWFYTVTCDLTKMMEENISCPMCCRGVHKRRYSSTCVQKKSYVMAYMRRIGDLTFDWDYIEVDSSCNCAITPQSSGP